MVSGLDIVYAFLLLFVRWYAVIFLFLPLASFLSRVATICLVASLAAVSLEFVPLAAMSGLSASSSLTLASVASHEALAGILLALPSRIALSTLPLAARFIDSLRGAQFAEQVFLDIGDSQSLLESAAKLLIPVIIFASGGLHLLISAIIISLSAPGLGFASSFAQILPQYHRETEALILCVNQSFRAALFLAAPVLCGCLILDLGACLLSRVLNRINMLFELMPLKMFLALMILAASVMSFSEQAVEYFRSAASYTFALAEAQVSKE